jgi:LuxR family maltose regulon positive regulatory protein
MVTPLLATKLHVPPIRLGFVSRPRLTEQLSAGLERRLTLISAPAGSGKTTLLSEWAHTAGTGAGPRAKVAWVSLDETDNDPVRFLMHLFAALHTVRPELGEATLTALGTLPPPSIEAVLTDLINEIATDSEKVAFILDDYHVIRSPLIHKSLTFLLLHLPPQMHVLIATRTDPPLPLPRLRAQGHLSELRTADLRFTLPEAASFLNDLMNLGLSEKEIAGLEEHTEGWIAGLQLAALAIQRQGDRQVGSFITSLNGQQRYILDYLREEVLQRQPKDVQGFLLKTSILNQMSAPLCDAVTGQGGSHAILEWLERTNLFVVPLDGERRWYRYHHLFRDLLRHRLEQLQPDQVSVLHRRASAWCKEHGLVAEAARHLLAAGCTEELTDLVEKNFLGIIDQGELTSLRSWVRALPDEALRSRPWLCVASAWTQVYAGQLDALEKPLELAERALASPEESLPLGADEVERGNLAGHIAIIRAYSATLKGHLSQAARLAENASQNLPAQSWKGHARTASLLGWMHRVSGDLRASELALAGAADISRAAGDNHLAVTLLCEQGMSLIIKGKLGAAHASFREALRLAEEYTRQGGRQLPVTGYAHACMSNILREWNELEAAAHHARRGIRLCQEWGLAELLTDSYLYLAWVLQTIGEEDEALDAVRRGKQIARGISDWYMGAVELFEAQIRLAQGRLDAASHLIESRVAEPHIVVAKVLIAQGRLDQALGNLSRLLERTTARGAIQCTIKALVLQAVALDAQGKRKPALAALARALVLGEKGGYVRTFIDAGPQMRRLLEQAMARGDNTAYVDSLMKAFDRESLRTHPRRPPSKNVAAVISKPLNLRHLSRGVEPLSQREMEVLQLLVTGLSNKEIASRLVITVSTVKNHLRSIYGKLDVHNRAAAAAQARSCGLL